MLPYLPRRFVKPNNLIDVPSAWRGLELILADIIETFGIDRKKALEFGVEFGYSTVALSNYFDSVVGVDTFKGDEHTEDHPEDLYEAVKEVMPDNVLLVESRYQDYKDNGNYDLIHVDIVHTYQDTFDCGDWAMQHSKLVIFHDTEKFVAVRRAVEDLADKYGATFYNYPHHYGLGILWRS